VPRRVSPKTSRRAERVASLIRTLIAEEILHGLNDPRIPTITSITRVEVSPDFAVARVHVSVMAEETKRRLCLAALTSAAGHLRWLLSQELTLRNTPQIEFRLDDSLRGALQTVEKIDQLMAELGERPEDGPAADAATTEDA
jgi:ribosome-binding factor A